MPEGHTLHRLALDLNDAFGGRTLCVSSPQGRFADSAAQLDGSVLVECTAHGKHLFCEFESDVYLHVHLGLIGKFRITSPTPPRGAVRVRFETTEAVGDLRGPILCALKTPAEIGLQIAQLGPDPLRDDSDPEVAWERISRSRRSIAALLMDQKVLSGVGNVYRAEVLFRARINPHRTGVQLMRRSWDAIWADLLELMPQGVLDKRINTVRPEHLAQLFAVQGRRGSRNYVYRRTGQPCWVCGSTVRTEVMAGRNLFWCPRCQRRG
ncbi:MAG TPA: DNA-formamidopyrimidine glycosylase family protein [Propionibacteriaceae bacterium]|nr:DNA-formamidopyrimidine glycosylase family protein [Propionibacteriaceae bacterium]